MGVRRVLSTFGASLVGTTQYTTVISPGAWTDVRAAVEVKWLAPAYLRTWHIVLDTAPGVGKSRTFNILIDSLVGLTITISGLETEGFVDSEAVAFAPTNAPVCLEHIPSGVPAAANIIDYGLVVDGFESNISLYGGCSTTLLNQQQCSHFLSPAGFLGLVLGYIYDVIPVAFTCEQWTVNLGVAPGTGESRTFTVRTKPPGPTGDPFTDQFSVTFSDDEVEKTVSPDVDWEAGTRIQVLHDSSAGAAGSGVCWCVRGRIDGEDGQSIFASRLDSVIIDDGTGYYSPEGGPFSEVSEASVALTARAAFKLRDCYVKQFDGTPEGTELFFTTRRNLASTSIVVNLAGPDLEGEYGFIDEVEEDFDVGDTWDMRISNGGAPVSNNHVGQWSWIQYALAEDASGGSPGSGGNGVIGPLIWVVINRLRQPAGTHSADAFSDLEMQDPATYYGSYKQPFLLHAGDAERALSDPLTGDVVSSTFSFTLGDQDDIDNIGVGRLRSLLASEIDRYWTLPAWFFCTTRANRAVLGQPFTAFAGNIVNLQQVSPRALEITLGDILTERIVNDKLQLPWRLFRDGFLDELDYVSDKLDLEQPEPILYGTFDRVVGEAGSPAVSAATGFRIEPIYLGIETVSGDEQHVWMVAGHACKSVTIYVDGELRDESDNWFVSMEDRTSSTYGTTRRYTLIRAPFGGGTPRWRSRQSEGDSVAIGDKMLTVSVEGTESAGDGTGTLITDFYEQYKHFTVNYLANAGPSSYHTGAWLSSPQWTNPNGSVIDVVDEDTFDVASIIGAERLDGGLIGAIAIGLTAGDRSGPSRWVAEFNRCGFCQSGPTQPFQWGITTVHPTHAAKDAAIHYTDAYEVLEGSFSTAMEWDRHATHFPWRTDYEHTSGDWKSSGVVPSSEADYYEHKEARTREYLFIPGAEAGAHLAGLDAELLANPPRLIRFDAPIGPDAEDDSLAYRNPGEYITYEHFDAVSEEREARLAYVQRVGVRGSARRAYIVAMDVEDLINFDIGGSPGGSP